MDHPIFVERRQVVAAVLVARNRSVRSDCPPVARLAIRVVITPTVLFPPILLEVPDDDPSPPTSLRAVSRRGREVWPGDPLFAVDRRAQAVHSAGLYCLVTHHRSTVFQLRIDRAQ